MSSSYRCAPKFQWIVFSSTGYECVHFKVRKLRKDYAVFVVLMHRECFSERRVASDEVLDVHPPAGGEVVDDDDVVVLCQGICKV